MTDLEMTRLCAEALGLDWEAEVARIAARDGKWLHGYERPCYDPLHDDAQAMALVKYFLLEIDAFAGMAQKAYGESERFTSYSDESINRAIVECVAKMQAAKK